MTSHPLFHFRLGWSLLTHDQGHHRAILQSDPASARPLSVSQTIVCICYLPSPGPWLTNSCRELHRHDELYICWASFCEFDRMRRTWCVYITYSVTARGLKSLNAHWNMLCCLGLPILSIYDWNQIKAKGVWGGDLLCLKHRLKLLANPDTAICFNKGSAFSIPALSGIGVFS